MQIYLIAIPGKPEGSPLVFGHGRYVLGRAPDCHVRLGVDNNKGVSRHHCLLMVTEQGAIVRDLQSRNGTCVNGERITGARSLREGDVLLLGKAKFLVKLDGITTFGDCKGAMPERASCDTGDILRRAVRPFPDETVNAPIDRTQG